MVKDTYSRARIEILNYIINFSTYKWYGEGRFSILQKDCAFLNKEAGELEVGSLCLLSSGPFTKYYLSWLVEVKIGDNHFAHQYLMKSIEDGSLCWWSNVGISVYPPETVAQFQQWRWTDRQFDFWDKWNRAAKKRDAYITLPMMPIFNDDGSVILRTRTRFGLDEEKPERRFENWKKVQQKDMLQFYDEVVAERAAAREAEIKEKS